MCQKYSENSIGVERIIYENLTKIFYASSIGVGIYFFMSEGEIPYFQGGNVKKLLDGY